MLTKPKPVEMLLFKNGDIAVLDENGTQIPELQMHAADVWLAFAKSLGFDVSSVQLKVQGAPEWASLNAR